MVRAGLLQLGEQDIERCLLHEEGGKAPLLVRFALGQRRLRPLHRLPHPSR